MDTVELQHLLNKSVLLSTLNAKVCPKDHLPQQKPAHVKAYIVNTHDSHQPGEHWVALFFQRQTAIYFDSYGLPPLKDHIQPFLERHCKQWTMNSKRLQDESSAMCGVYCIFALDVLARGCDLESVLAIKFHPYALENNDKEVAAWFKRGYGPLYQEARHLPKPKQCQCCTGNERHLAKTLFQYYVLNHDYLF